MTEFLVEFEHAFSEDFRKTIEAESLDDAFEKVFRNWDIHPNEVWSDVTVTELGESRTYSEEDAKEAVVNEEFWETF